MPVYGTIASQFNDPGTNTLYKSLMALIAERSGQDYAGHLIATEEMSEKIFIIPPARVRYLSEITENNRRYNDWALQQAGYAQQLFALDTTRQLLSGTDDKTIAALDSAEKELRLQLDARNLEILQNWPATMQGSVSYTHLTLPTKRIV